MWVGTEIGAYTGGALSLGTLTIPGAVVGGVVGSVIGGQLGARAAEEGLHKLEDTLA